MTIKFKVFWGFFFILALLGLLLAISYVTNHNIEDKNTTINMQIAASDERFSSFGRMDTFSVTANTLIQNILKLGYALTDEELDRIFDEINKDIALIGSLIEDQTFDAEVKAIFLAINDDAQSVYQNKKEELKMDEIINRGLIEYNQYLKAINSFENNINKLRRLDVKRVEDALSDIDDIRSKAEAQTLQEGELEKRIKSHIKETFSLYELENCSTNWTYGKRILNGLTPYKPTEIIFQTQLLFPD